MFIFVSSEIFVVPILCLFLFHQSRAYTKDTTKKYLYYLYGVYFCFIRNICSTHTVFLFVPSEHSKSTADGPTGEVHKSLLVTSLLSVASSSSALLSPHRWRYSASALNRSTTGQFHSPRLLLRLFQLHKSTSVVPVGVGWLVG